MNEGAEPNHNQRVLDAVAHRADESGLVEREAQVLLSRAAQLHRMWGSVSEQLRMGRSVAAFLECERGLKRVDLSAQDVSLLQDLNVVLQSKVDQILATAESTIPETLARLGLELDRSARHPNYTVESGFISIDVDERKLIAAISSRGGSTRREPLDPEAIAEAAVQVRDRVFHRKGSHVTAASLIRAYRALRLAGAPGDQDEVAVDAIRLQLSPKGRPIPADEFNVDLASLIRVASNSGTPRIALSNTRDIRAGMLLHGLEDAGYVGYLKIEGA